MFNLRSCNCCRKKAKVSDWDAVEATPSVSRWDATPGPATDATPGRWDQTPGAGSRWDATPGRADGATPGRRNRWDETPTPGRVSIADDFIATVHAACCSLILPVNCTQCNPHTTSRWLEHKDAWLIVVCGICRWMEGQRLAGLPARRPPPARRRPSSSGRGGTRRPPQALLAVQRQGWGPRPARRLRGAAPPPALA